MHEVILRNARAEQYLCAARKNFIMKSNPESLSESTSKTVIGHFSDIHGDLRCFAHALELFEQEKPLFAIHTGDMVTWNLEDDTDCFYEGIKNSTVPILNCIGNHDTFNNKGFVARKELDRRYIQPLHGICDADQRCYYFVDFEKEKLRLIVLNPYDDDASEAFYISQKQCDWLIHTLKESAEKEYGVLIAGHEMDERVLEGSNQQGFCQRYAPSPWGYPKARPSIIADIVDAFQHGKRLKKSYHWWNASLLNTEVDCCFEKKGEFIFYMCGHYHGDYVGYLQSYPDQLSCWMTCSGCFPEGYHNIGEECSDLPRIPGTVSEDAVNFYVIDRKKKTVTAVRFGASVNDLMEERMCAVYSYGEK